MTATQATQIFNDDGFCNFSTGNLVSSEELRNVPRDVGSVWEGLEPGEVLSLSDGDFVLDKDLDLIPFIGYDECGEATYLVEGKVVDGHQARKLGAIGRRLD